MRSGPSQVLRVCFISATERTEKYWPCWASGHTRARLTKPRWHWEDRHTLLNRTAPGKCPSGLARPARCMMYIQAVFCSAVLEDVLATVSSTKWPHRQPTQVAIVRGACRAGRRQRASIPVNAGLSQLTICDGILSSILRNKSSIAATGSNCCFSFLEMQEKE